MNDDPTQRPKFTHGPWRLLVLDASDRQDPRWILLSVSTPGDVRPADLDPAGRHYTDWPAVTAWVRGRVGRSDVSLVPTTALVWRVDEGTPRTVE